MKLLRTKIWAWYDIGLLKGCVLLFGMIVGAYFHEYVMPYAGVMLAAAVLLAMRPAYVYYRD
jgi:hypothetical protein